MMAAEQVRCPYDMTIHAINEKCPTCIEYQKKVLPPPLLRVNTGAGQIRKFETGAVRPPDAERHDPEGFLSPIVLERFNEYMTKHRVQVDGGIRASDNWQKGIPRDAYMKGMLRHTFHLWTRHRGYKVVDPGSGADIQEDLCAIMFNAMGYLFELLKDEPRFKETQ